MEKRTNLPIDGDARVADCYSIPLCLVEASDLAHYLVYLHPIVLVYHHVIGGECIIEVSCK